MVLIFVFIPLSTLSIWIAQYKDGVINVSDSFFITSGSLFGSNLIDLSCLNLRLSARMSVTVICIGGSLIFYKYSTFLFASLIVKNTVAPFTNPYDLVETDYQ